MLDLVRYWLGMYMHELRLFCGKNEALSWLEKVVNTKEVLLKILFAGWAILGNMLYLVVEKSEFNSICCV